MVKIILIADHDDKDVLNEINLLIKALLESHDLKVKKICIKVDVDEPKRKRRTAERRDNKDN